MTIPALELRQLTKRFADVTAVDRVDLLVPKNSVVALVGESGSGKTTTGLLALWLLAATSGQILLNGEDISGLSQAQMKPYRRQMQVVRQDVVREVIAVQAVPHAGGEAHAHRGNRQDLARGPAGPEAGTEANARCRG